MENIFKENANKGGVYRILNKKNGREYFGSTARFKQRAREHLFALKNNKHYNHFFKEISTNVVLMFFNLRCFK